MEISILSGGIETGTSLLGMEEVMPHDEGLGIAGMERFEKHAERHALRWSAGVGRAVQVV